MYHIPFDLRKNRLGEVNKPNKHRAQPQVLRLIPGQPVSSSDSVLLAHACYTDPPNPAACLLVGFCFVLVFLHLQRSSLI